jgi:CDP-diacylglycerol--glycerol-3-phosphate 3-phosphatidyltransferase
MIVEGTADKKDRLTLEKIFRTHFKGILDPAGNYLNRIGLKPNTVTIIGLVGNFIGAFLLAMGYIRIGGIIVFLMGPIDALDGTMARLRGEPTSFGGFVDSVTDRYSELVILLGLLIYYLNHQNWFAVLMIYLAASGSVLVSYVKARAEGVGYSAKVGVLTRLERYLVLAPALMINYAYLTLIALGIIAVFANITALQRIFFVRKQAYARWAEKKDKTSLP